LANRNHAPLLSRKIRSLAASSDDKFLVELVERTVDLNFSVRTIRSPEELPAFLEGLQFDWVFLDVELGWAQCLQIITTLGASGCTRVVLVGDIDASHLDDIRRNAISAGLEVVGVLDKPLSFSSLVAKLTAFDASGKNNPNGGLAAIPSNEIEVHYQPIVSMPDRVVCRTEALVRWRHPEYGLINPEGFISLAERSGAIIPLTWDVLAKAVEQQVAWRNEGLFLSMSVNMSALVLTSLQTAEDILALLEAKGADPRTLILELTETERAPDPTVARALLARMREAGVGISMDDYGVGYSNLGRLQYYPFSDLKMDRGLVARLPDDEEGMDIVSMLASLAAREGVGLTGEGVETQEQWDALEALGCNFGQGFLIARPMPADQVPGWIAGTAKAGRYWPPRPTG
jgi:EAL domain-containing protein (putative c-di-GMP-specific phosphodiesterase class I)